MGNAIIPVVMCGGAGTVLWPVSRDSMPKQFISLLGGLSTFQRTMRLLSEERVFDRAIVITNAEYRFIVRDQLAEVGVAAEIVLEPARRDSGPAVATATELALLRDPEAVVGVFAADHVMQDGALFVETCARAGRIAAQDRIVTIGVRPTYPGTGYGYIRPGAAIGEEARAVAAFVEKPDEARAGRYLLEGCLWNSGNFIFCARTMRGELEAFEPEAIGPVVEAVARARRDLDFLRLHKEAFGRARKISIDYAVMERTRKAAVVPGDFGWSDVGGWAAVWALSDKDEAGNAVSGRGYALNARNNLISAEDQVVGVIGLDDVAVIATHDAVLVTPKAQADQVKTLVALLVGRGESEAPAHAEIHRPWGKYLSIDMGGRYQVKRITVKPGGALSLQKASSPRRALGGGAWRRAGTRDDETIMVHENESIYLPIGCVHCMDNPGLIPLELIEVQVGSYLGEDGHRPHRGCLQRV